MKQLEGKVAFITGASSGIGKATAQLFLEEGATVVGTDLREASLESANFLFLKHDVTQETEWEANLKKAVSQFGGLDILVNCAGIPSAGETQDAAHCTLENWRRVLAVNLDGVFLGCKHAIPHLEKRGSGSIINISSYAASIGIPFAVAYGASKAGVSSLTKSVALYCVQKNRRIRCNSIAPGAIDTPIWDPMLGTGAERTERARPVVERIPMREFGRPGDVAQTALFLAGPSSRFMTGAEIRVDGGQGAHG